MTLVSFSKKELEKHFPLTEENIEKISLLGTPLERVTEKEIEIEVFPNRPDLISLEGFVRAFKAFLGKPSNKEYKTLSSKEYKVIVEKSVKDVRPFIACAVIKNLKLDNEKLKGIIEVQEKLHNTLGRGRKKIAIGIYPLDKIKFPIVYKAENPTSIVFQPLDGDKEMNAIQIIKRNPTADKYKHLLSGMEKYPVFRDANSQVLSLPPLINSELTGRVTETTKDLFVECSGSNLPILKKTISMLAAMLSDLGGVVYSVEIVDKEPYKTPDFSERKMKVSSEKINNLLGLNLNEKQIASCLAKLGHSYKNNIVSIPSWRTDILHEVDIIEEVAIGYGYHNFSPEWSNTSTIGEETRESIVKRAIAELFLSLGAVETLSYHLIRSEDADRMKIQKPIVLEDSKTDYKVLRPNLTIPSLVNLSNNVDNEYPQKIFEIGRVFSRNQEKETGIEENDNIAFAIAPGNFTLAKQHLDYLFKMFSKDYSLKEVDLKGCIEGRTAEIVHNNKTIGYIGEIHPSTLREWKIKMPVVIFEINISLFY